MLIGDNAIGTLRVNLDYERRTTICVTIESTNSSVDPLADVYLMTTSQYDRYTTAYDISNGYFWLKEDRDDDDPTSDVPPEWRFYCSGMAFFQRLHQYENVDEVSFSISLDGPEIVVVYSEKPPINISTSLWITPTTLTAMMQFLRQALLLMYP